MKLSGSNMAPVLYAQMHHS